jgi:GNAT superfamily N-acetyltransferase
MFSCLQFLFFSYKIKRNTKGITMKNSNHLIIREANQRRVLKDFIRLPYRLYKDNPYWTAPLLAEEKRTFNPKHNAFLRKNPVVFYVCYKNNRPVGRIAGIINKNHNDFHKDRTGFFGFFESIDDEAAAGLLFRAAVEWLKKQGVDALRGPTNFSINDISGLLLDGFEEPPFILMPYNAPYYERLYRRNGFDIAMRFFAYDVARDTIRFPGFVHRLEKRLEERDIKIRHLRVNELEKEFRILLGIFNESWNENWGFVPFPIDEAVVEFTRIKPFVKEDLILIAEHEGKAVGFALALPDINQVLRPLKGRLLPFNWLKLLLNLRKINRIRVVLMGVLKEHRSKGIDLMFYKKIVDNSLRHGYHRAELSWILESNLMMNRVLGHINARRSKVYAIFEKKLPD